MEIITSTSLSSFFSSQFFVAAIFTVFSVLLALLTFRSSKSRKSVGTGAAAPTSKCSCSCNGFVDGPSRTAGEAGGHLNSEEGKGKEMFRFERNAAVVTDRGTGASMMEQLVPEITTHALSYLDYPSLCRLSMTNSLMRKAANDDNAWKALYHKVIYWLKASVIEFDHRVLVFLFYELMRSCVFVLYVREWYSNQ